MDKIDINKRYVTKAGEEVVIYTTEAGGNFPVHVCIKKAPKFSEFVKPITDTLNCLRSYTIYGTVDIHARPQYGSELDLEEYKPPELPNLKQDDKLEYTSCGQKYKGHFAGYNSLRIPLVYPNGTTSFTYDYDNDGELEVVTNNVKLYKGE